MTALADLFCLSEFIVSLRLVGTITRPSSSYFTWKNSSIPILVETALTALAELFRLFDLIVSLFWLKRIDGSRWVTLLVRNAISLLLVEVVLTALNELLCQSEFTVSLFWLRPGLDCSRAWPTAVSTACSATAVAACKPCAVQAEVQPKTSGCMQVAACSMHFSWLHAGCRQLVVHRS